MAKVDGLDPTQIGPEMTDEELKKLRELARKKNMIDQNVEQSQYDALDSVQNIDRDWKLFEHMNEQREKDREKA